MKQKLLLASIILIGPLLASAQCPDWLRSRSANLPVCPEGSGSVLVPETFPVGAVVVSDRGFVNDENFTTDVVEKVLRGAGERNPLIVLPVNDKTMSKIQLRIDQLPVSRAQKKKWKASLLHVPAKSWTWQQDYMQSFIDPNSGKVVLREVQGYQRHGDSFEKIIKATKECGFVAGPPLTSVLLANGVMGGNIETLPAGICLVGDDSFARAEIYTKYADQICGPSPDDRIKVPTSWLRVGHTDEIVKVVRNKSQRAPCDFSVVLASPKRALELLKRNPDKKFLNFVPRSKELQRDLTARRIENYQGLKLVCRKNSEMKERLRIPSEDPKPSQSPNSVTRLLKVGGLLIDEAFAGLNIVPSAGMDNTGDCTEITNDEVYELFTKDEELKNYNQLVQSEMDNLKSDIQAKLKKKLPQCKLDFMEVPDLFFGGQIVHAQTGMELPKEMGVSVLPNPTNAMSINDTIITPDPSNDVFKADLEQAYRQRGLNPEFIDTFDYAHMGMGNLHCSTNTIHVCRPRRSR